MIEVRGSSGSRDGMLSESPDDIDSISESNEPQGDSVAMLPFSVGDGVVSKASSISTPRALSRVWASPMLLSVEDTAMLSCQGLFIYSGG